MTTANSSRTDNMNIEHMYEEYGQEESFEEYDDLDEEYGDEPTYERMNKQKGLKKMRW